MLKALEGSLHGNVPSETSGRPQSLTETRDKSPAAADSRFLPTCSGCFVRETGACPGFGVKSDADANKQRGFLPVPSQVQVFPARRSILHQREIADFVPVICSGWAASSIALPNGRKQIVSFLLAGEAASMNYLFEPCSGRAIEAVSQVSCRKFRRNDLQEVVTKNPLLVASLGRALGEERERGDQLSLDLSRRSAEARLARLICSLVDRLRRRGQVQDDTIEFPMRQQQLADATGLTAVHVCKILSRFRASGLLQIDGRRLTVLDQKGLQGLVEWD
jgi:CRP-like cAMP-binding protein